MDELAAIDRERAVQVRKGLGFLAAGGVLVLIVGLMFEAQWNGAAGDAEDPGLWFFVSVLAFGCFGIGLAKIRIHRKLKV